MLDYNCHEPITGERREHFEELRNNHIPQFLFRAWHPGSGGGVVSMINTTNAITPPAFMPGQPEPLTFYENAESTLYRVAQTHIRSKHIPSTMFSSWGASLNFILCYARCLDLTGADAHVAIMDRDCLDSSVHVWHVPHVVPKSNLEYLAYGVIRGPGYEAVRLRELEENGLVHIFREKAESRDLWSVKLRQATFQESAKELNWLDLSCIGNIALLFGNLIVPMASALVCFRPRRGLTPKNTSDESHEELQSN